MSDFNFILSDQQYGLMKKEYDKINAPEGFVFKSKVEKIMNEIRLNDFQLSPHLREEICQKLDVCLQIASVIDINNVDYTIKSKNAKYFLKNA